MAEELDHIAIAQEARDKFERYAVALTFSILGLAIPTGHFGNGMSADNLELLAWIALLSSGLLGLYRLEKTPVKFETLHKQQFATKRQKTVIGILKQPKSQVSFDNEPAMPLSKAIEKVNTEVAQLGKDVSRVEVKMNRLYRLQRATFLLGILTLPVARAHVPLGHIVSMVRQRVGH
jgi:hypothetical protein